VQGGQFPAGHVHEHIASSYNIAYGIA